MTDLVEAVARALCETHIRVVRRHDTAPKKLEAMMADAVEYAWSEFEPPAQAAIAAIEAQGLVIVLKEPTGEYICNCGIRVEPHRCRDTKGAF
jgi:hypothetical protein